MKRTRLQLGQSMSVETAKDFNGRFFICYAKGASVFLRDAKEVRRFMKLPLKTTSRDQLDEWLTGFESSGHNTTPQNQEQSPPLSAELLQSGFGPECHLDEADPNYQTRTII